MIAPIRPRRSGLLARAAISGTLKRFRVAELFIAATGLEAEALSWILEKLQCVVSWLY